MFETWPTQFDPPPHRTVDPPTPVLIRLSEAIARAPAKLGAGTPLRIRSEGLDLDQTIPGKLHAWARVNTGEWLALLTFQVKTGNGMGYLDIQQWCPSSSITPNFDTTPRNDNTRATAKPSPPAPSAAPAQPPPSPLDTGPLPHRSTPPARTP